MTAVAGVLIVCLASGPAPQELGSAAQRATEQRRAAGQPVRTLTDRDLAGSQEPAVNAVSLEVYANVRAELAALRRARPALHARLFDASRGVSTLTELEPVLAGEPAVLDVLARSKLTAREFLRMERAVLTALYWSRQDLPDAFERRLVPRASVQFVRDNPRLVRELRGRYEHIERGQEPWFDMARFVDRF